MLSAQFLKHENPLVVCPIDKDIWIVHATFAFVCQCNGEEHRIEVPPDFVTDFASIPRLIWPIMPRWGTYGWAAVIHDFLYWDQRLTRREADDVFLDVMKASAVPTWQKIPIYRAVRQWGWWAWKRNEQNPQNARRNNFPSEQISRWFLLLSENLSASNYPGAALPPSGRTLQGVCLSKGGRPGDDITIR
jgi:hypothetical protein